MRMKEVLNLRYSICNGPHPHTTLWQASTTSIMSNLEVLQLVPPCTNDLSDLDSSMLLHFTQPHAEIEEDFEDHVELRNEVFTLERLELQTRVDDATENEAELSSEIGIGAETPSLHLATRTTQPLPGNSGIMDPETPTLWLATRTAEPLPGSSEIMDPETPTLHLATGTAQPLSGNSKIMDPVTPSLFLTTRKPLPGNSEIMDLDSSDTSDNECCIGNFWEKSKRPSELPSIRTIFDAIEHPEETVQQQQPTAIWREIMKLHMPVITERVMFSLIITVICSFL
jgi:hypothetical protein